jgi:hypothetical protein
LSSLRAQVIHDDDNEDIPKQSRNIPCHMLEGSFP